MTVDLPFPSINDLISTELASLQYTSNRRSGCPDNCSRKESFFMVKAYIKDNPSSSKRSVLVRAIYMDNVVLLIGLHCAPKFCQQRLIHFRGHLKKKGVVKGFTI